MTGKRKISIRKVLQFVLTIVVVTGCVLAITSASKQQQQQTLKGVDLRVLNEKACHFLDEDALENMLFTRRHINPMKLTFGKVDVHRMEAIAKSNPWVSSAQAYVDNNRVLHVTVTQRVPVVRIFEEDGGSYYLDTALKAMPLSQDYAHYAPVVTHVPEMHEDSASRMLKGEIVSLVEDIAEDTFWNAQVAEVVMTPNHEFELIPVLGSHRILLGDTSHIDEKLSNLLTFYRNVLDKIGWERYTTLDVRYAGQVVASPSLPWKAPVDRALSNMNWVKSIVGNAPEQNADNAVGITALPIPAVAKEPAAPKPEPKPKPVVVESKAKPAPKKLPVAAKPKPKAPVTATAKAKTPAKAQTHKAETEKKKEQKTPKYVYPNRP